MQIMRIDSGIISQLEIKIDSIVFYFFFHYNYMIHIVMHFFYKIAINKDREYVIKRGFPAHVQHATRTDERRRDISSL